MAAAKKAAATKKAAAPVEDDGQHFDYDRKLAAQVVRMRDKDGLKWDEIAEQLETTTGKVLQLYICETCPEDERITGSFDKRRKAIPKLRDEGMSWAQIVARVDLPESRVRAEYEDQTGTPTRGLRVGRGGRYPLDSPQFAAKVSVKDRVKADRVAKAAKKAAAKKQAAPPAETTNGAKPLTAMSAKELGERLNGLRVLVERSEGNNQQIVIGEVKAVRKGEMKFTTVDGEEQTLMVSSIKKVAKRQPVPA